MGIFHFVVAQNIKHSADLRSNSLQMKELIGPHPNSPLGPWSFMIPLRWLWIPWYKLSFNAAEPGSPHMQFAKTDTRPFAATIASRLNINTPAKNTSNSRNGNFIHRRAMIDIYPSSACLSSFCGILPVNEIILHTRWCPSRLRLYGSFSVPLVS
jgi:hypothetical protein